jgi:hypothetical protein
MHSQAVMHQIAMLRACQQFFHEWLLALPLRGFPAEEALRISFKARQIRQASRGIWRRAK